MASVLVIESFPVVKAFVYSASLRFGLRAGTSYPSESGRYEVEPWLSAAFLANACPFCIWPNVMQRGFDFFGH